MTIAAVSRSSMLCLLFGAATTVNAWTLDARAGDVDAAPPNGGHASEGALRRESGPRLHVEGAGSHFFDLGSSGAWQPSELGYGVVGVAALEWALSARLGFELRMAGGRYRSARAPDDPSLKPSDGASFFALAPGFRAHPFHDMGGLSVGASFGIARTGSVFRPTFDARLGWDFALSGGLEAGPYVGYLQVLETGGSLRPQDARAWLLGFQLSFGRVERPSAPRVIAIARPIESPTPPKAETPPKSPCEEAPTSSACAPPEPPPLEVVGDKIVLVDRIHFEYASSKIEPDSLPALQVLAKHILSHTEYTRVRIEGHTDEIGGDEWNMKLSIARAEAVKSQLVEYGVPVDLLRTRGFGKTKPQALGADDAARRENRRVEFHFEVKKP